MTPEGGFWNSLKGLVEKWFRPPPVKQKAQASQRQSETQKEEKKEKAAQVAQELERITPQHWAYELLKNVNLNEKQLKNHDELANFIIEIIRAPDPNQYHDLGWLKTRLDKLDTIVRTDPSLAGSSDMGPVNTLQETIGKMLEKANKHIRKVELEKEQIQEELMSDEAIAQDKKRVEAYGGRKANVPINPPQSTEEKKDWYTLATEVVAGHQIPADPLLAGKDEVAKALTKVKAAAEKINEGQLADREGNYMDIIGQGFLNAQKYLIRELGKTSGPGMKDRHDRANAELEKITTAWEKTARHIMEKVGGEGGRLFDALRGGERASVEKLIMTDANYRDYWFYHILEPILYNQKGDGHRELYNLYVAGDMDSFLEIVRRIRNPETGERVGLKFARRYDLLKNTIFQSHDMDYYAAHPSQEMKEFIGSTSLFSNKYIDAAMQDPLVSMGKRAYEVALLNMRDTNGNFIPREWLEWEEGKLRASKLDEDAEKILTQMIELGQLKHIKTDDVTGLGLPAPSIWNRKQIDHTRPFTIKELYGYESDLSEEYRKSLGDLKIAAALKQAKGLALVDQRFLEIISQSRGTGTEYEQSGEPDQSFSMAARNFNSVPYEGIVRHINPIVHYYTRFRMGGEYYDAFFNMLLLKGVPFPNWDPQIVKKTVEFHLKGDNDGAVKYLQSIGLKDAAEALKSRLLQYENPFEYSGMWGPWTHWRIGDASISFDDEEREQAYGTNIKLITASDWATRQARRLYETQRSDLYKTFRTEYRNHILESNNIGKRLAAERDENNSKTGGFDDEFEAIWRKEGKDRKADGQDQTYRRLLDADWREHKKDYQVIIDKLQKAYIARTWAQSTSRSPTLAARYLETEWVKDGFTTKSKLRNKIIWDILGVDVEEIAAMRTPTSREESGYDRVTELEGTVSAISQVAIRENRQLQAEDFDKQIKLVTEDQTLATDEPKRRAMLRNLNNAKAYWQKVQKAVLGEKTPEQFYQELGIDDPDKTRERGARMHQIDWDQVNKIVNDKLKLTNATGLINDDLLGRNYKTTLFSTEDMGWEYLNVGALGERNPVRRAGDLASHVQFGQLFEKYINELLVSRPKIDDLTAAQKEMWTAMSGDFEDVAIRSTYRIAETTGLMYKKADISWKIPFLSPIIGLKKDSSVMQMIRGRDRADAWGPNELLEYTQAVGGKQMIAKREYRGIAGILAHENPDIVKELESYSNFKGYTSGALGKSIGGTKSNAIWEIINMTLMIATILTIWRAATAKSEEEE